jgi:heptosyltransferase-2
VPGGARNVLRESPHRRWPVGAYRAVAERLAGAGLRVALVGDANDRWVLEHFAGLEIVDLLGTLALRDTLRVLRDAAIVLSHDTGPMHLARLVRAPLVALFGPTTPSEFMLEDERTTVLWGGRHLACRPCYDGRDFAECGDNVCMQSIRVDDAWAAVERLIARAPVVTA